MNRKEIADKLVDILLEQADVVADDLKPKLKKAEREIFIAGYVHGRMDQLSIDKYEKNLKRKKLTPESK